MFTADGIVKFGRKRAHFEDNMRAKKGKNAIAICE